MRKKTTILSTFLFFLFITTTAIAQLHSYEISTDPENGSKVLRGLLIRADIQNDTSFKWFNDNMKFGQANAAAVEAFKKHTQDIQLIVFGGTWCEDTQNLLPVFYKLIDKSGFPDSSITLVGVDRPKTTLYNLHKVFNVTKAPTFIVIKDGKEIGRVEEYGKYGQIDKELGEIVAAIQ
ncbi:hypothetical protein BH10BAC2_BH10BAC2_34470 [soil metagenome]